MNEELNIQQNEEVTQESENTEADTNQSEVVTEVAEDTSKDENDTKTESDEEVKSDEDTTPTEEDKFIKETNKIDLVGTVIGSPVYSHEYDGETFYSLLLRVVRPYNKKKFDDIHVFINKDDLFQGDEIIDQNTRLQISGHIVQSKLHDKFDISVVALSAKIVDDSVKDKNRLKISGTLYKLFDKYNIEGTNYVVKSLILSQMTDPAKKYKLTIKLSAWNTTVQYIERSFKENDRVFVSGQLVSKVVKSNDEHTDDAHKIILHEGTISVIEHISDDTEVDN